MVTQTASLLLCLYSLLLVLLSAPAIASFPIAPAPHPTPAAASPSPSSSSSSSSSDDASSPLALHAPIPALAGCYGVYELKGRRHYMEDTHAVYAHGQLSVSRLAASSAFGAEVVSRWNGSDGATAGTATAAAAGNGQQADWVLFGVFDGHGGQDASAYTATHLLQHIHHKLAAQSHAYEQRPHSSLPVPSAPAAASASAPLSVPSPPQLLPVGHNLSHLFSSSFQAIDDAYFQHPLAHHHAHRQPDGSTALVVGVERGLGRKDEEESVRVVVANAGDCRALLILDETAEGKELVKREDGWLWPCRTQADSDSEESEVDTACARADSDSESDTDSGSSSSDEEDGEREEEEDDVDEKTAIMREAELQLMYRHFHPLDATAAFAPSASASSALPIVASSASSLLPLLSSFLCPWITSLILPTEHSRITALPSGFVTTSPLHSVSRVQGVLATSRAIGDYELRPFVHCQPDVVEWKEEGRTDAAALGRWLLLGSDGFFDVYANEVVGRWVREMGGRRGMDAQRMAKELVLSAYRKGADDNITVMIVDLHCLRRYR